VTSSRVIHIEDKEVRQIDHYGGAYGHKDHTASHLPATKPRSSIVLLETGQICESIQAQTGQDKISCSRADAEEWRLPLIVVGDPGWYVVEIAPGQGGQRDEQTRDAVHPGKGRQIAESRRRHLGSHEDHGIDEIRAQSKGRQSGHGQSVEHKDHHIGRAPLEDALIAVHHLGVPAGVWSGEIHGVHDRWNGSMTGHVIH